MIVQCRPSLVDHLLDEFDCTAQYENALIETYSFEEVNESNADNWRLYNHHQRPALLQEGRKAGQF